MNLVYEAGEDCGFSFNGEEIACRVIEETLHYENAPPETEVSLTVTDDENIRRLNREFREIDRSTDVLSFPAMEFYSPGFANVVEESVTKDFDTGDILLGDIIISAEHVKAQAIEYGHSEKREFAFLIVHSMLHLLGYDHMEEDERLVMEEKQKAILSQVHINREATI